MSRSAGFVCLALALCALVAPASRAAEAPAFLVLCDSLEASRAARDRARELADHLGDGYSVTHPSAVALSRSMAEITSTLDSQMNQVEPASIAFLAAWDRFDQVVRRSHLPRDPALRSVLPAYRHGAAELASQLGCADPAEGAAMIPCTAIPTAHLLAVLSGQIHDYLVGQHAESYPEQTDAAGELARTSKILHQVLHDLEIAVPGALGTFGTLTTSLAGSSLTDTDEPQDVEVKSRLAAVGEVVAALESRVGSCQGLGADDATAEPHDHH